MTRNWKIIIGLMTGCVVVFVFLIALPDVQTAESKEYLLDSVGCAAAKRLGTPVAVEDGMCAVRVKEDFGSYLRIDGGARLSKDHVLGWRAIK